MFPPHCLLLSNRLLAFEKFSMPLNLISRYLPFGLWSWLEWCIWDFHFFIVIYCIMGFPKRVSPETQPNHTEEFTGNFLLPNAVTSRAILILSTLRSAEQLETHPSQWESHQHCCWGNRSKKQIGNQGEEGQTLPERWRHLPAGNFLSQCFPAR